MLRNQPVSLSNSLVFNLLEIIKICGGHHVTYYWIKKSYRLDKIIRRSSLHIVHQLWMAYLLAAFCYFCADICSLKNQFLIHFDF